MERPGAPLSVVSSLVLDAIAARRWCEIATGVVVMPEPDMLLLLQLEAAATGNAPLEASLRAQNAGARQRYVPFADVDEAVRAAMRHDQRIGLLVCDVVVAYVAPARDAATMDWVRERVPDHELARFSVYGQRGAAVDEVVTSLRTDARTAVA